MNSLDCAEGVPHLWLRHRVCELSSPRLVMPCQTCTVSVARCITYVSSFTCSAGTGGTCHDDEEEDGDDDGNCTAGCAGVAGAGLGRHTAETLRHPASTAVRTFSLATSSWTQDYESYVRIISDPRRQWPASSMSAGGRSN